MAPVPDDTPEYDRSDWRHWVDADGDCQDARQEVLVEESMTPVTFETDRGCRVATGRWYGAFTGVYVEDPSDLDIDHLVPLKNAHLSGGWRWDADKREEYANDLEEENHLIAVTASANRSKGAKGPEEWGPPELGYWCQYATDWTEVKARWDLTMTKLESEIVMDMLGTCENPPDLELWEALKTATGELSQSRQRSRRARCTGHARRRSPRGKSAFWGAGAEEEGFRRLWCRAPETETGMG